MCLVRPSWSFIGRAIWTSSGVGVFCNTITYHYRKDHSKSHTSQLLSAYNTIDNTSLLKVFSTFSQTSLIDLINGSIGRISGSLPISFIRSISFFHYLKQNMGVCLLGTFLFKLLTFVLLMFLYVGLLSGCYYCSCWKRFVH